MRYDLFIFLNAILYEDNYSFQLNITLVASFTRFAPGYVWFMCQVRGTIDYLTDLYFLVSYIISLSLKANASM